MSQVSSHRQTPAPKGVLKRLFGLLRLLGIVLFVVIMFRVDFPKLLDQLSRSSIELLLTGVAFQLIVLAAKGIRWHLMNEGQNEWTSWRLSLGRFYESYAIGVVTPARMGELLKAGHEKGTGNVVASGIRVLAERGLDIGVFVILAGLSVLGGDYLDWSSFYGFVIVASGLFALFFSMLLLASASFNRLLNSMMQKLPGKLAKTQITARRFSPLTASAIVLLSLISNISYFVSCYFLGLSTGLDAGFIWTSGAVAVSGLLNMLPVTIMGVGTRELTFLYVFRSFPQALVLSFSFLVMLIAQMGGGLVALLAGQLLLYSKSNK